MSDDLLSKMTSALAEEHDGATAVPEATRARVVRTLAERKPRRRKWLSIGIPAFVLFGGSTAWAAATGNLPRVVQDAVSVLIGETQEVEEVASAPSAKKWKSGPPVQKAPEEPALEPSPEEEEPEAEEPDEALVPLEIADASASSVKKAAAPTAGNAPAPKAQAPQPPPEDHTALLTYRAAHRAHFQQGDCDSAVAGYKKYLREQPGGTFALEAKYNLGVCLVRKGQAAEAKKLLQPFADGAYGNYRKDSAQKLIEAL